MKVVGITMSERGLSWKTSSGEPRFNWDWAQFGFRRKFTCFGKERSAKEMGMGTWHSDMEPRNYDAIFVTLDKHILIRETTSCVDALASSL